MCAKKYQLYAKESFMLKNYFLLNYLIAINKSKVGPPALAVAFKQAHKHTQLLFQNDSTKT